MIDLNFAVDLSSPGARRLFEYWVHGKGAAKIRWGTDNSMARCIRHLTGKVIDPGGLCAEYHKAATGEWPRGGLIPSAGETESFAVQPRLRWRALLAVVDQSTGDKRRIAPGALTTRRMPLPLLWQRLTVAGKHDGAVVVGLIDKVEFVGNLVYGEGDLFTPDPNLMPRLVEDIAELRYITEQGLGGPSIDIQLDELTFEYQGNEAVITNGRIAAATLVQVPAFAETKGAFEIYENDVLVASVGVMLPFEFISLEQWEESKHPRDAEGKFKEKPGGDVPGLPSVPSVAIGGGTSQDRAEELIRYFTEENEFGLKVREELTIPIGLRGVDKYFEEELRKRFGSHVQVDLAGLNDETAREFAEGILRVADVFPRMPLAGVGTFMHGMRGGNEGAWAHATYGGIINMNRYWGSTAGRERYLTSLRISQNSDWHPPGSENPITTAIHEAFHITHYLVTDMQSERNNPTLGPIIEDIVDLRLDEKQKKRGVLGVSVYSEKDTMELVAEACLDVMTNGERAAPNSKKIFKLLVREYEKKSKSKVKIPERVDSPQNKQTRKILESVDFFIETKNPEAFKRFSREDLLEAAKRLKLDYSPGDSDDLLRLLILKYQQQKRKPEGGKMLRSIGEYVDLLRIRSREDVAKVLENRNYDPRKIARELKIKTPRGMTEEEINQKILDKLFGGEDKKKPSLDPEDSKSIALAIVDAESREEAAGLVADLKGKQLDAVGDQFRIKLRGTLEQKRKQLVEILGAALDLDRGSREGGEEEQKRRDAEFKKYIANFRKQMRQRIEGKGEVPEPKPEPEEDQVRYVKRKAPGGPFYRWYYQYQGREYGPHSTLAVARLAFEKRDKGDIDLKETDLQKFRYDLQTRVDRLSVAQVAQQLGVSQSTVRNWLKGSRPRNLDVVSRTLRDALDPKHPVPDVDEVRVSQALHELFDNRDVTILRSLDTEALRRAVKDQGLKLRSNASRDSLLRALIEKNSPHRPGDDFHLMMSLIHGLSRQGAKKELEKHHWTPLDIAREVEAEGDLIFMDDKQIIDRILDKLHGSRRGRLQPLEQPAASGPDPRAQSQVPEHARKYNLHVDGIEDLVERVEGDFSQAETKEIVKGNQGGTKEEITFPDGTKAFGKRVDPGYDSDAKTMADREQLGSRLGQVIDAPVPRAYRSDEDQIYFDWVEGSTAWEFSTKDLDRYERIMNSNAAKRLGLLDMLMGNTDRHEANMNIEDNGRLHGMDHGFAWSGLKDLVTNPDANDPEKKRVMARYMVGPGKHHYVDERTLKDNPLTPEDVSYVRAKLRELEPEFEHLGRQDWLRYAHAALDLMEPHARGTKSIFSDMDDTHQRRLFDDPGNASEYHVDLADVSDMVENLQKINDHDVRRGRVVEGGMGGRQERVFYPDGSSMFLKDYGAAVPEEYREGIRGNIDREQLGALVGQALRAPVPRAVRDREGRIATEWIDGEPVELVRQRAMDTSNWDEMSQITELGDSQGARLLGLLDVLIDNQDRHEMNLILGSDGQLHGIDHGQAWRNPGGFYDHDDPEDRFMHALYRGQGPSIIDHDGQALLTEGDIEEIERRLEALRPQFEHLGREQWLKYSLDVLEDLKLILKPGAKSIFDSNWDEEDEGSGDVLESGPPPTLLTRQAALDVTPGTLTRPSRSDSNRGDYSSAKLDGPEGMGSAETLAAYEGVEYYRINQYLRHGPIPIGSNDDAEDIARINDTNAETAGWVADIDQTMAASRLTEGVQVERVIQYGAAVFGRDAWYGDVIDFSTTDFDEQDRQVEVWESGVRPDLTGLQWREDAYVSTTADPETAPLFGERWPKNNSPMDGEPVIMTIRVPAGVGGVQLSEYAPDKAKDRGAAEILLERGLTMRVVADNGVDEAGFRRLDVEVVRV